MSPFVRWRNVALSQASRCTSWQHLAPEAHYWCGEDLFLHYSAPSNTVDLRNSKNQRERNRIVEKGLHNSKSTSPFLIKKKKIKKKIMSSAEGWIPVTDPLRMSSVSLNVSLHKPWKLIHVKSLRKTKPPLPETLKISFFYWGKIKSKQNKTQKHKKYYTLLQLSLS